jgi:hypothetical protein
MMHPTQRKPFRLEATAQHATISQTTLEEKHLLKG